MDSVSLSSVTSTIRSSSSSSEASKAMRSSPPRGDGREASSATGGLPALDLTGLPATLSPFYTMATQAGSAPGARRLARSLVMLVLLVAAGRIHSHGVDFLYSMA